MDLVSFTDLIHLALSITTMPNHRIEWGTKLAGIKFYEHGVLPLDTILDILEYP